MADDLLARMRNNPAGDWTIADVQHLCRRYQINCRAPSGGSHFKVEHPASENILTIPARRPIRPKYIRLLAKFIDNVIEKRGKGSV